MTGAHFTADREGLVCGSELGRQVTVDLEADADLDKGRGRPRDGRFLFILIHRYSPLNLVQQLLECHHSTNPLQLSHNAVKTRVFEKELGHGCRRIPFARATATWPNQPKSPAWSSGLTVLSS